VSSVPAFSRNGKKFDSKSETKTLEALKTINGFGSRKVEKYGRDITGIISAFFEAAPRRRNAAG
jgi:hypothetical protein